MNEKNNKKNKNVLRSLLLYICIITFVITSFLLVRKLYGYYIENRRFEGIRSEVSTDEPAAKFDEVFNETQTETQQPTENKDETVPVSTEPETEPKTEPEIEPEPEAKILYKIMNGDPADLDENGIFLQYSKYKKRNEDLVGWIVMPGFKKVIDYPVMQYEDNEYYLDRDFDRNTSYSGSIFMDMNNAPNQPERHFVIYGHAMNDRSMFGNLKEFSEKPEAYMKNNLIYLDLLNYRLEYQVFSTYYVDARYNYRQTVFNNEMEFLKFLERIRDKSVYDYGLEFNYLDKILTLSTCNNNIGEDTRSVVHAKLVRQINYSEEIEADDDATDLSEEDKKIISSNVYLSKLSLAYEADGISENIELDPGFHAAIRLYTAQLPQGVDTVNLDFTTADPDAKITKITMNDAIVEKDSIMLYKQESIIKIWISSRSGEYSRIYAITVNIYEEPEETTETTETAEENES